MRKSLLAGAVAALALLAPSTPARAQSIDWNELLDTVDDIGEILDAPDDLLEILMFLASTLPEPFQDFVELQIARVYGRVNQYPGSYLPNGADLDVFYPGQPEMPTIGDAKYYIHEKLEDRKQRVGEAMDVASEIVRATPDAAGRLALMGAANKNPVGTTAVLQLGNEINLQSAMSLVEMNNLLAQLGQLEADQRTSEEWQRVMSFNWAEYHYRDTAFWTGSRSWQPDSVDTGW